MYLAPKWYGSIEQMVAYGRQSLADGDWSRGVPLVLLSAHLEASQYADGGWQPKCQPEYFERHPDAFADVQAVYGEYLKRFPDSVFHRSRYAMIAAWAGKWDIADRELRLIGDRCSGTWETKYDTTLRALKQEVAAHVTGK